MGVVGVSAAVAVGVVGRGGAVEVVGVVICFRSSAVCLYFWRICEFRRHKKAHSPLVSWTVTLLHSPLVSWTVTLLHSPLVSWTVTLLHNMLIIVNLE